MTIPLSSLPAGTYATTFVFSPVQDPNDITRAEIIAAFAGRGELAELTGGVPAAAAGNVRAAYLATRILPHAYDLAFRGESSGIAIFRDNDNPDGPDLEFDVGIGETVRIGDGTDISQPLYPEDEFIFFRR